MSKQLVWSVLCCIGLILGCQKAERPASMAPDKADKNVELKSPEYIQKAALQKPATDEMVRKIIRNGDVQLVVKYYEPFFQALQKKIISNGGYISQIQVYHGSGEVSSAKIVLRLRPELLDLTVSWLKEQGVVTAENLTAEDISEQYYDLKARHSNARRFEQRLQEMLKSQTGQLEDVLKVEEKLNLIREQIEQFEGKLRYFDNLVDLTTLTLNISVQEKYVPAKTPGFGEKAASVWRESVGSLKDFTQATGLLIVAIIPWIVPILIFSIIVWKTLKFVWRSVKVLRG